MYRKQNKEKEASTLDQQSMLRLDLLDAKSKKLLIKDLSKMHSFKVCNIINSIEQLSK